MTAIQADEQLLEGPNDRPLQTRYPGELDCKLTIELSLISGIALLAGHDSLQDSRTSPTLDGIRASRCDEDHTVSC
jgi:hypothetical protein